MRCGTCQALRRSSVKRWRTARAVTAAQLPQQVLAAALPLLLACWTACACLKCAADLSAYAGNDHLESMAQGFSTLSTLSEILCTQQEATICETLETLWLKVLAALLLCQRLFRPHLACPALGHLPSTAA